MSRHLSATLGCSGIGSQLCVFDSVAGNASAGVAALLEAIAVLKGEPGASSSSQDQQHEAKTEEEPTAARDACCEADDGMPEEVVQATQEPSVLISGSPTYP